MELDHINIKAPRALIEDEKRFFCEVLGLREGPRPNFPFHGYWLYSGDTALVHLSDGKHHVATSDESYFDHVAFRSTGLREWIRSLEQKGIAYSARYLSDIGLTQVFVRTPSNTRVEVDFKNEKLQDAGD